MGLLDWLSGPRVENEKDPLAGIDFEDLEYLGLIDRRTDAVPTEPPPEAPQRRLDSIRNYLSGLGTPIDKGAAGRPDTKQHPLSQEELQALFRFNGLARKVVLGVPQEGTAHGWRCNKYDFTKYDEALKVREKFRKAWMLDRRQGGSTIFMVIEGDEDVSEPISNPRGIKCLHVFERDECYPVEWDGDPLSARFREPTKYLLSPISPATATNFGTVEIHWSRIIHFGGEEVSEAVKIENRGFGDSILQSCFASIRNRTAISQAGTAMAQDFRVDILKIGGLAQKSLSDVREHFFRRMDVIARIRSVLSLIMISDNEEYVARQTNLNGWSDLSKHSAEDLAAETETPLTKLFGLAPGGLNADGEAQQQTWAALVHRGQTDKLEPALKQYYDVLAQVLGVADYGEIEFLPIWRESRKESAEATKLESEAYKNYVESQILNPMHVARSLFGQKGDGLSILKLSDREIQDYAEGESAEAEAQALAEQALASQEAQESELESA